MRNARKISSCAKASRVPLERDRQGGKAAFTTHLPEAGALTIVTPAELGEDFGANVALRNY